MDATVYTVPLSPHRHIIIFSRHISEVQLCCAAIRICKTQRICGFIQTVIGKAVTVLQFAVCSDIPQRSRHIFRVTLRQREIGIRRIVPFAVRSGKCHFSASHIKAHGYDIISRCICHMDLSRFVSLFPAFFLALVPYPQSEIDREQEHQNRCKDEQPFILPDSSF